MKPHINNSSNRMSFIPPPFPFPEAWPHLFQTQQTKWLSPSFALSPPSTPLYAPHSGANCAYGAPHPSSVFPSYPPQSFADPAVAFPPPRNEDPDEREVHSSEHESNDSEASSEEGEYVYGYVLSDAWRGRFRSSLQARQQQQRSQRQREQQQQRKQAASSETLAKQQANAQRKKTKKRKQFFPSASDQRAMDLEREFATAKQREATARRPMGEQRGEAPPSSTSVDALQSVRRLETQLNLRFDTFCDAFLPVVWPHDAVHK